LENKEIDVALLPVNGRDELRTSRGVLGNFSFEESVGLCKSLGISKMICHHFGMFDFNTVDINILNSNAKAAASGRFECIVPQINLVYHIYKGI
jgi:L-ascorbate metabolism protein UlaG (beta-lactamase superfamily)